MKRFWSLRTLAVKRYILIKHLRNCISVKSNTKRFAEFTNWNLSQRLFEFTLIFFNDVEKHQFPSYCTTSYLKLGARFFSTVTWVLQLHTVWSQKKIGLLILLNCEAASLTVFTTMCPKEQQTSNNLIVLSLKYLINLASVISLGDV